MIALRHKRTHPLISKQLTIVLIATWIVLISSSINAADDSGVVLPAEWYFGRWTQGVQMYLQDRWQNGSRPSEFGSASWTTDRFRVGADNILRDYLLFSKDSINLYTADFYGYVRPSNRLQIGVAPVNHSSLNRNYFPDEQSSSFRRYERADTRIGFSVDWLSADDVLLSGQLARLQYFGHSVLPSGTIFLRVDGNVQIQDDDRIYLTFSPLDQVRTIEDDGDILDIRSDAAVLYGASDYLTLELNLGYYDRSYSTNRMDVTTPSGNSRYTEYHRGEYTTTLGFGSRYYPFDDWVFRGDVEFRYARQSDRGHSLTTYSDGSTRYTERTPRNLSVNYGTITLGADYITASNFVGQMVLHDFNDFFHHQVSRGQFIASFELVLSGEERSSLFAERFGNSNEYFRHELTAYFAYGLIRYVQLSGQVDYSWYKRSNLQSSESIQPEFGIDIRTYEYKPGGLGDWNELTALEIATRPIVPLGKIYASNRLTLEGYDSPFEAAPGFFAFEQLHGGGIGTVSTEIIFGLGLNTELSTEILWLKSYERETWMAGLRTHLIEKVELKLGAEYFTREGKHAGVEPTYTAALTAVL